MKRSLIQSKAPIEKLTQHKKELAAFVGSTNIITPGDLIFDPNIIDGSVRYWCALRECLSKTGEVRKPPTQEEMSQRLGINRKTAATYFNILRATRWLLVVNTIREHNLITGYSYLLHDARISLEAVIANDSTYIDFIIDSTKAKNKRLQHYCSTLIQTIPNEILTNEQTQKVEKYLENHSRILNVQNLRSEGKPDDQILPSEGKPADQILPSEGKPADQILPSEGKPADQILPSEDIYNTARTPAPAQSRIIINNNNLLTTTSSSRSDFDFFEKRAGLYANPVLGEIIDLIRSDCRIGNANTHALINLLKRKRYETHGESFQWLCTEDKAIQLLIAVLQVMPDQPLPFLKRLIFKDSQGDFGLKRSQLKLLDSIRAKVDPNYHPPAQARLQDYLKSNSQKDGRKKLFDALFNPNQADDYKPLELDSGMVIKALMDLPQWDMTKGKTTTLKLPNFAINQQGEARRNQIQAQFGSVTKTIYYGQLCKAIELGVIKLCE